MKAAAEKSSSTASTTSTQAANQPFFAKASGGSFFSPAAKSSSSVIRMKMTVNKPGDKFEQEADQVSAKVMRVPTPVLSLKEEKLQREVGGDKEEEKIQKNPSPDEKLQRRGDGIPSITADIQAAIESKSHGQPLSADVRRFMEPRFGADFGGVRIHNDAKASALSNRINARAFTYQNHIFFSNHQYQPGTSEGRQLLAHELTHTLQQRGAVQRTVGSAAQVESERPAGRQGEVPGVSWWDEITEFSENLGWQMLEEVAPRLVPFVRRGPVEWFKEKLSTAAESVFATLLSPVHSLGNIAPSLAGHLTALISWIQDAAARIAQGDCGALAEAAEKIQQVFEGLAAPVVEEIKSISKQVKTFFNNLWEQFGAPVWEFLQRAGGEAWAGIQQVGNWIRGGDTARSGRGGQCLGLGQK